MSNTVEPYPHESLPVGNTEEDRQRNAELLAGYDYDKYPEALTGFTGQDLQRIGFVQWEPAVRTRVGPRGNYKSGFARLADGTLVMAVCRDNNDPDPALRRFSIHVYESSDLGLNWREIGQTKLAGKEPSLAALHDKSLVLIAQGGYFGPGADPRSHTLARSEDGGRTWDVGTYESNDYPRNIVVEPDGSLLFATAVKPDWENGSDGETNLLVHRSRDGGRTWSTREGEVDWDHTIRLATSNGFWVGWAVTLQLPDQSLVTSYATTSYPEQPPEKFTSEVVRWHMPL